MMALGPLALLGLLPFLGGFGLPVSLPPLPPDPVVQRAAPEECLFYLGWNGNAKPDPNSKNRTEQLLADQEVQRFVDEVGTQIGNALAQTAKGKREAETVVQTLPGLIKTLVTRPTALYVAQVLPKDNNVTARGGLVVNVGSEVQATAEALGKLETLLAEELGRQNQAKMEEVTIAGVKLKRLTIQPDAPVVFWGFKDNFFVAIVGADEAEALLGRLSTSGKRPSWLEQLHKKLPVHRPAVASYFNVALALKTFVPLIPEPKVASVLDALGVSDIKSVGMVSGLTATGAVGKAILVVEGERKGVLAMLPAKPLALDDLKVVPRNATFALAARFNFADTYKKSLELFGSIEPRERQRMDMQLAAIENRFGVKLLDDVLQPLGDSWAVFSSPGSNVMTGVVLTGTLSDGAKFAQTHDKLLKVAEQMLAQQGEGGGLTINQSMAGDTKLYTVQFKSPIPVAPSWALTNDRLVVGVNAQIVKDFLERKADAPTLADIKAVQTLISRGGGPSVLSYQDTLAMIGQLYSTVQMIGPMATGMLARQGINVTIPTLPTLERIKPYITPTISIVRSTPDGFVTERYHSLPISIDATASAPVLVALLLPAVQSARAAARRNVSSNNLKQIGLAMHNHLDAYKKFPAAAISDKEGKPLLSWRVKLLPFVEGQHLYQQFHLNEPWDSEHNRKLVALMPSVYADPANPALRASGKTRYVVPTGEGTMFQGSEGLKISEVTDGTSKTLLAVEAAPERAVIWTKPDDLPFDPKKPLEGLIDHQGHVGGFNAVFADGSVRLIHQGTDEETLRRLFNPSDGQPVDPSF